MPGFKGLAVPGPTNMPFRVRQAMDVALEDHRAPDFPAFTLPLFADLKKIFQTTTGQVFIFPGSGTGGWESAIANTLSPGDTVLASIFGQFSLLWVDLCQRFGLEGRCDRCRVGQGRAARPLPGPSRSRQDARDQGRAGDAERDRDRRHLKRCRCASHPR